jgi:hypothetical protein
MPPKFAEIDGARYRSTDTLSKKIVRKMKNQW